MRSPRPLRRVKAFSNLSSLSIELPNSLMLLAVAPKRSTFITGRKAQSKLEMGREAQSKACTDKASPITPDLASEALVRSSHRHTSIIDGCLVSYGSITTLPSQLSPGSIQISPERVEDTNPTWNLGQIRELIPFRTQNSHSSPGRTQISQPTDPRHLIVDSSHALVRTPAYQAPDLLLPNKHGAMSSILADVPSARRCVALSSHPITVTKPLAPSQRGIPAVILPSSQRANGTPIDSAPTGKRAECKRPLHPMDEAFKLTTEITRARSNHFSEQVELLTGTIIRLENQAGQLIDDAARQEKHLDRVSTQYNDLKLKYRYLLNSLEDLQQQVQELSREFEFHQEHLLEGENYRLSNTDVETLPIELPIAARRFSSTIMVDHQIHELSASASNEDLRTTSVDVFSRPPGFSQAFASTFEYSQPTVQNLELQLAGHFLSPLSLPDQARSDDEMQQVETEEPMILFRFGSRRVQSAPAVQRVHFTQSKVDAGLLDDAFFSRLASWEWVSLPHLELIDPRND